MENGEGKSEPLDGEVGKMDGEDMLMLSPVSSRYSSCGESDFERYCSANSVMGTPSVCSSMGFYHDFSDPDFGLVKNLEGFTLGGEKFHGKFEKRQLFLCGEISSTERDGSSSSLGQGPCADGVIPMLSSITEGNQKEIFNEEGGKKEDLATLLKNVENVLLQGAVAARSAAETLFDGNHADEMEDERCREQDDASSSRYEHSDGEDSMFNYGSDGGSRPNNTYYVKSDGCNHGEDMETGNLVLMNPSVAFGSKDWEDFELDGGDNTNITQSLDNLWEKTKENAVISSGHLKGDEKSYVDSLSSSNADIHSLKLMETAESSRTCDEVRSDDGSDDYLRSCSFDDVFEKQCLPHLDLVETGFEKGNKEKRGQDTSIDNISNHDDQLIGNQPLRDGEPYVTSIDGESNRVLVDLEGERFELQKDCVLKRDSSWFENDTERICEALNVYKEKNTAVGKKATETNSFCDELVHEMEEILLDSCNTSGQRTNLTNAIFHSKQTSPLRDGEPTTSSLNNEHPSNRHFLEIDGIEVVGAKHKNDISLSERLVGVRGYTAYVIRVWNSNNQWEVERRYRDFYSLYRQLKTHFVSQGRNLPSSWSSIEQESKKFFGNGSADVIADRSALIQECLTSVIQSECSINPPSALIWFLSPPENIRRDSDFGKTISLIVEMPPKKCVKELLEGQNRKCAGCRKIFDMGKSRMEEIVKSLGWGKPRVCEYTGQLFCSSCHTNDTAVLPARVLHHWDFTPYPVSQIAKSYLDSIVDQPMICVSAANPFLFSRVPTLLHIVGIRRKIGAMLPCIRCSFRRSIYKRLGYRKYLLETRDFFALRDLVDLSKGVFAALPTILEAVMKKIQEHIIELCLECCDSGVPCGARQACENPSSLIFPFQEEDAVERCKSCKSVFHKNCYDKMAECPCGAILRGTHTNNPTTSKLSLDDASHIDGSITSVLKKSESKSSVGFLSSLFPVSRQGKVKESDNVILMGSLPTTSL